MSEYKVLFFNLNSFTPEKIENQLNIFSKEGWLVHSFNVSGNLIIYLLVK